LSKTGGGIEKALLHPGEKWIDFFLKAIVKDAFKCGERVEKGCILEHIFLQPAEAYPKNRPFPFSLSAAR